MFSIKNLNMFQIQGNKTLISNFSLQINSNDKIVLLGEEGTGKSSFLKVLANKHLEHVTYKYDFKTENCIISYVGQIQNYPGSIQNFVYDSQTFFDYNKFYQLLDGFGLSEHLIDTRFFNSLSGGEKVKLALVKALLKDADILFLDEPTNDLDLESIEYLEQILQSLSIPIVFISHDIQFIKNLANGVIHFEQIKRRRESKVTQYNMNYETFKTYRQSNIDNQNMRANKERESLENSLKRFEKLHDRVHHELTTVSRQAPSVAKNLKDKMRSVKAHEKQLEKKRQTLTNYVEFEEPIHFILNASPQVHNKKSYVSIDLKSLSIKNKELSKNVKLEIIGPLKIAIVGKNGVGKTTLLKTIIQTLDNSAINYAYMPQNYEDIFDESKTPVEIIAEASDKESITQAMTFLGSIKFTQDEMNQPFSKLSGGQRAKLFFGKMATEELEFLVLDEPTRNLSPLSMETLIESLITFDAAVLAVTHDRNLLDRVFEIVYELTPNGLKRLK